jgi:DNA-binding MarR family transcriptional regulator
MNESPDSNRTGVSDCAPSICPLSPAPLAFQVLAAAHAVEARLEDALGQLGLSLAKFRVLAKLAVVGEPLPLGGLAEHCSCVRSNMTQLVDRLEADKLVERVNDPSDRRSVRAALTDAGRERHGEAVEILARAESEIFTGLAADDRDALARLVQQLTKTA